MDTILLSLNIIPNRIFPLSKDIHHHNLSYNNYNPMNIEVIMLHLRLVFLILLITSPLWLWHNMIHMIPIIYFQISIIPKKSLMGISSNFSFLILFMQMMIFGIINYTDDDQPKNLIPLLTYPRIRDTFLLSISTLPLN